MRESFVIHAEYIEDLPVEYKSRFLQYVYEYGIHEIVPQLTGLEKTIWKKIQRRIDIDRGSYRNKVEYNEDYNYFLQMKRNGTIDNNMSFTEFKKTENFKNFKELKKLKNLNKTPSAIDIDIVNDIDNDIDIVNDIDIDNDIEIENSAKAPSSLTPSQTELSKQIMLLMKDAHLPCARGNEISFLQRDFNNAIGFLHKTPQYKSLHSDEIISAVKNYIEVIQDTTCYYKKKMDLFTLVQSKQFWSFLPGNFDITNFRSFDAQKKTVHEQAPEIDYSHAGEIIEVDNG